MTPSRRNAKLAKAIDAAVENLPKILAKLNAVEKKLDQLLKENKKPAGQEAKKSSK